LPHVSVYVDESGDLGFSAKSSKSFTVSYVFTINRYPFVENKLVTRTLKEINIKNKNHRNKINEFKFSNDSEKTRMKFLSKIASMDIVIGVLSISKVAVVEYLREDPNYLYNYLVGETIIDVMVKDYFKTFDPYNSIRFVIDRSLSKRAINAFNDYCEKKTSFKSWERSKDMENNISIKHENSQNVPMLQVADYVAGAIQQKFERDNPMFYDVFKHKIKHTKLWDFSGKMKW